MKREKNCSKFVDNKEKKNPPDKGLEPLALRLKVSRSTD